MTHIWIPIVITALLQWASHYFPWVRVFGKNRPPRLVAYTIGVIVLLAPVSIWAAVTGLDVPAWALWASAGASGIGVGLGYWWDRMHDLDQTARELKEQNELLKVQRDAQE
jgi:hypothetical protein